MSKRSDKHHTDVITITAEPGYKGAWKRLAWENDLGPYAKPNVSALVRWAVSDLIESGKVRMSPELKAELQRLNQRHGPGKS
jgi:hypothetical protein